MLISGNLSLLVFYLFGFWPCASASMRSTALALRERSAR